MTGRGVLGGNAVFSRQCKWLTTQDNFAVQPEDTALQSPMAYKRGGLSPALLLKVWKWHQFLFQLLVLPLYLRKAIIAILLLHGVSVYLLL